MFKQYTDNSKCVLSVSVTMLNVSIAQSHFTVRTFLNVSDAILNCIDATHCFSRCTYWLVMVLKLENFFYNLNSNSF